MAGRKNFKEKIKARREEAAERQAIRDKRSDKEQFEVLKKRGHPSCREAIKLLDRMAKDAPSHKTSIKLIEVK